MKPSNLFRTLVCLVLSIFTIFSIYAQKNVEVDLLTGTAMVKIPIYTVQRGDLKVPISLQYRASGLLVEDYDQRVGQGWRLVAETSITRTVRGFPDDLQYQAPGGPLIKGWKRATDIGTKVANFSISNDGNYTTCPDEVTDYSYMNTNFGDYFDTEPDIFTVMAPGLFFQFVFDKDQNIKTIPYQDVKITYTVDAASRFTSFTVIDSKGLKYVFDQSSRVEQRIADNVDPNTIEAFKRNYMFYHQQTSDPMLTYYSKWYVSLITDNKNNSVRYMYDLTTPGPVPKSNEKIQVVKYNPVTTQYEVKTLYTNTKYIYEKRLSKISDFSSDVFSVKGDVEFKWNTVYSDSRLDSIKLGRRGELITFSYSQAFNHNNDQSKWGRIFLDEINMWMHGLQVGGRYRFEYDNVDIPGVNSYLEAPDSITNAQDYWGYYNGAITNPNLIPPIWVYPDNPSVDKFRIIEIPGYAGNVVALTGVNRAPSSNAVNGTLKRIYYPSGAVTELEYENKQFLDKDINAAVTGGGIRIKKITHNDGLNTNEITHYEYTDPVTGVTTGRAISIPKYGFAFANTTSYASLADRVKNSTYRTPYNFSEENTEIIHTKVTVRKTNGGRSIYEFNTAGTWGSPAENEWQEPVNYVTRPYTSAPSPCNALLPAFLVNDKNTYPFSVYSNYDFQRGLIMKVTHKNEAGNIVSEEDITYTRSHAPSTKINALKYDDATGIRYYVKYDVVSTVDNLLASRTTKTYNSNSPGTYTMDTETFTYLTGANDHRLPVGVQKTNSDGNIHRAYIKYAKDYTTTGTGDATEQAIHNLKLQNANLPVETWQTIEIGGVEKAVSGSITKYGTFLNEDMFFNMYLPAETWKFVSQDGISGFTASSISGGNFTNNSAYFKTGSVLKYDIIGQPATVADNSGINKTVLLSPYELLKTAEISNAKLQEVIYSDFDYYQYAWTTWGGNTRVTPGFLSYACLDFQPSTTLSRQVSNATTNTDIIFSCWLKDAAAAGNITVNLNDGAGLNVNHTVPYTAGANWQYYEISIPRPAAASYTVNISTSHAVKIDDILFYPGDASVKCFSYVQKNAFNSLFTKNVLSAEKGMGGAVVSFEYDQYNRPMLVKDVDNNIREMKLYRMPNAWPSAMTFTSITWPGSVTTNVATTFTANVTGVIGVQGVSYSWNWGDGSPVEVTTSNSASHTFASPGNKTINCTVAAPGLASVTSSNYNFTVTGGIITPVICAAGIVEKTAGGVCIEAFCTGLTGSCTETKFKVSSVSGCALGDLEWFIWEKAPIGTETWTTIGTGAEVTVPFTFKTTSYKVRCRVTSVWQQEGTSNSIQVIKN